MTIFLLQCSWNNFKYTDTFLKHYSSSELSDKFNLRPVFLNFPQPSRTTNSHFKGERTACEKAGACAPHKKKLLTRAAVALGTFLSSSSAFEVNICTQTRFHHSWFSNSLVEICGRATSTDYCPRFSFTKPARHGGKRRLRIVRPNGLLRTKKNCLAAGAI